MCIKGDVVEHKSIQPMKTIRRVLKKTIGVAMLLGAVMALAAYPAFAGVPLPVAVSIPPQACFVRHIGGTRVHVFVMLPSGANPATYEPKPRQLLLLSKTSAYFRIRVPFENAWMEKFTSVNPRMRVVDTTRGISERRLNDPHIWLAPALVKVQARTICKALSALDPSSGKFYEQNLARFEEKLSTLSKKIRTLFRDLKRRTIVVYHPCWGYFAQEFGLKQIAVQHEGKSPGASALAGLITAARKVHARCIFAQPQFDTRSARILAGQIGGKVVLIDPLAEAWERNLLDVAGRMAACLGK